MFIVITIMIIMIIISIIYIYIERERDRDGCRDNAEQLEGEGLVRRARGNLRGSILVIIISSNSMLVIHSMLVIISIT